jgi:hypothetical protein
MEENKMKSHVTVVAGLRIALSGLGLIGVILGGFAYGFVKDFIPLHEIPEFIVPLIDGIIIFVLITAGAVYALGIIGGIGLLSVKPWARILTIVVSALSCLNIPFGTLVGVYSIWVLMQDDTIKMFRQ